AAIDGRARAMHCATMTRRNFSHALAGALGLLLASAASAYASGPTVFAAASLSEALGDVAKSYQQRSGIAPTLSFAASSVLARQIEASSGADIFIAADTDWMDYLDQRD